MDPIGLKPMSVDVTVEAWLRNNSSPPSRTTMHPHIWSEHEVVILHHSLTFNKTHPYKHASGTARQTWGVEPLSALHQNICIFGCTRSFHNVLQVASPPDDLDGSFVLLISFSIITRYVDHTKKVLFLSHSHAQMSSILALGLGILSIASASGVIKISLPT